MSLLSQLQAAAAPAPQKRRTARAGRMRAGKVPEQVLELMADGEVWTARKLVDRLGVPRSTANSSLRRLVQFERISVVGEAKAGGSGTTNEYLYRIKESK